MDGELRERIDAIGRVLHTGDIVSLMPDKPYIQTYYRLNRLTYTLFHTRTGLIHMGLSRDGTYKEDDLLEMARIVAGYVSEGAAKNILELATGRGANSLYLAKRFPNATFHGIDISETQLSLAFKHARKVKNYHPAFGDYHDLKRFNDATFDVVFILEALCYSTEKETVLREVRRVLKGGGLFIVFDGYSNKEPQELTESEIMVQGLIEKGMAVAKFESYRSFIEKARPDFQVVYEEDLSDLVVPTMQRLEKMSRRFFSYPRIARIVSRIVPRAVVNNTVSAFLMPTAMKCGLGCYKLTVLRK